MDYGSIFATQQKINRVMVQNEGIELDNFLALDMRNANVENRNYSPTFEVSRGVDLEYGPYIQLDNWKCANNQERCWIGFTGTEVGAKFKDAKSFNFYIYNPLEQNIVFMIMLDKDYTAVAYKTLVAGQWNLISIDLGTNGSKVLSNPSQIGIGHNFNAGGEGSVVGSGWKITSFYATF